MNSLSDLPSHSLEINTDHQISTKTIQNSHSKGVSHTHFPVVETQRQAVIVGELNCRKKGSFLCSLIGGCWMEKLEGILCVWFGKHLLAFSGWFVVEAGASSREADNHWPSPELLAGELVIWLLRLVLGWLWVRVLLSYMAWPLSVFISSSNWQVKVRLDLFRKKKV